MGNQRSRPSDAADDNRRPVARIPRSGTAWLWSNSLAITLTIKGVAATAPACDNQMGRGPRPDQWGFIAVSTNVSQTWDHSTLEQYPCSDGEPMAENAAQYRWMVLIKEGIEAVFAAHPNVFVAADMFWYAVPGKTPIRVAPDVMVAFGRPKGHRDSYMMWVEDDIPPQVVFEILSPGNRRLEMERKFRFYNRYGADEYYLYNPGTGELRGYLRGESGLEPIPRMKGFRSPRLGITFHPRPGPENLVIRGPDGKRFLFVEELRKDRDKKARLARKHKRASQAALRLAEERGRQVAEEHEQVLEHERIAQAERLKAQAERQKAIKQERIAQAEHLKAQAERQRANEQELEALAQRQRAERLAAKLRELGVEPD